MYEYELIYSHLFNNNNIDGALVECGVHEGYQQAVWINTIMQNNLIERDIYLYDTFTGLVEPSKHDYAREDATLTKMNQTETYNYWQKT